MFDLIIKNASIIDGAGGAAFSGDMAVKDGKIAALDHTIDAEAGRVIDAKGLTLTPGFIDLHSHWDTAYLSDPEAEVKLRQGVCLDLVGNCGMSITPVSEESLAGAREHFAGKEDMIKPRRLADYADEVDNVKPSIRVMSHVGHSTLRILAMGHRAGPPKADELELMKEELAQALDQGAAGLSTGLYYPPSGYAGQEELNALVKVVGDKGRFHASHIRNEGKEIIAALNEVIAAGRAGGAATHVSHLKMAGRDNWARADEVVRLLEDARARGLDLTCDVYPYARSSTGLSALVPPWAQEGGVPGMRARLNDKTTRDTIKAQMKGEVPGWENTRQNAGFEGITISAVHSGRHQDLVGRSIAESAEAVGLDPYDLVLDLLAEEGGAVSMICASMNEDIVARFMALPFAMVGSDGSPTKGLPHPRLYGTFPRVIRRFVRELKVFSLETAIAKMTGMPAARLGLKDTGLLKPGFRADLVLFDAGTFGDTATFEKPRSYADGLALVMLAGRPLWEDGALCGNRPGGFVRAGMA